METLSEHATAIFWLLGTIIFLLLGIIGFGIKFWLVDLGRWKTEITVSICTIKRDLGKSIDSLKDELHKDIVRIWRHIGILEGKVGVTAPESEDQQP